MLSQKCCSFQPDRIVARLEDFFARVVKWAVRDGKARQQNGTANKTSWKKLTEVSIHLEHWSTLAATTSLLPAYLVADFR